MSALDTDRFRTALVEERRRVVAAIENLHDENPGTIEDETGEVNSGSDNHPGDVATAMYDRELEYTLEGNEQTVLAAIDAALGRIDDGTYGVCRICGRQISPERLEARPWTDLCIDDARREEGRA